MPEAARLAQRGILALAILLAACSKREPVPGGDIAASLASAKHAEGGAVFDPATLKGKRSLVVFASPTCPHCMKELPDAQKAAAAANANLVAIFLVGGAEKAVSTAKTLQLTAPVLVDDGTLRKRYGLENVPYTLVLAADGHATQAFRGEQDEATLRQALAD